MLIPFKIWSISAVTASIFLGNQRRRDIPISSGLTMVCTCLSSISILAAKLRIPCAGVSSRHIYQNKRINTGYVNSRRTSIHRALYLSKDYRRLNIRTSSLSIKSNLAEWYDWGPSLSSPRYLPLNSMWSSTSYYPPMKLQRPNVVCPDRSFTIKGMVWFLWQISLSACKDDQVAWEDNDRALMTNVRFSST